MLLIMLFVLAMCGVFYPVVEFLSEQKLGDLEKADILNAKTAVRVCIPSINKSLEQFDDIDLLSYISSIARVDNISSCTILDRSGNIELNSKGAVAANGADLKSKIYVNALNSNEEILQKIPSNSNHLLFSVPLTNNNFMFCILSVERAKEMAKYWKIKYYVIAIFTTMILAFALYFIAKFTILIPFDKTKKDLERLPLNEIKSGKYNSLVDVFVYKSAKEREHLILTQENNESLKKIVLKLQVDLSKEYDIFVILDFLNNVVFAKDFKSMFLKESYYAGSDHIFEIAKSCDFVKLIAKANEQKLELIQESINNYFFAVTSIVENNKLYGTLIKGKIISNLPEIN